MRFEFRHINRTTYPTRHVMVCEDDLDNQLAIVRHIHSLFEPQGHVQVSVVPGGLAAAAILSQCVVDLILLDHDMPQGSGADLLEWMREFRVGTPVITFSGLHPNNDRMMALGAHHKFVKGDVIAGAADDLILKYLA
jgi:CheY-like chemotaxis protein